MKFAIAAIAVAAVVAKEETKKEEEPKATCLKGIKMQTFTDDKCTKPLKKDDKAVTVELSEDHLKVINSKCNEIDADDKKMMQGLDSKFVSMNVKCDAKAMNIKLYQKEKCDGDATAQALKWGDCKEIKAAKKGDPSTYYTITGAAALQATAALALAFVGSQF